MARRPRRSRTRIGSGVILAALGVPLVGLVAGSLISSDTITAMNGVYRTSRGPVVALRQPALRQPDIHPVDLPPGAYAASLPASDPFWALASRDGSGRNDLRSLPPEPAFADIPEPPIDIEPVRIVRASTVSSPGDLASADDERDVPVTAVPTPPAPTTITSTDLAPVRIEP